MNELVIDLREVNTKQELHNLLSSQLGFPDWYGNNWDAFWDLIRDTEIVTMPDRLVLLGFKDISEKLPKDARILRECFVDLKQKYPEIDCEVVYLGTDSGWGRIKRLFGSVSRSCMGMAAATASEDANQ